MSMYRLTFIVSTCSAGIGFCVGQHFRSQDFAFTNFSDSRWLRSSFEHFLNVFRDTFFDDGANLNILPNESILSTPLSSCPDIFRNSTNVHAAAISSDDVSVSIANRESINVPTNRVSEIMRFGFPNFDNVRFYENYVIAYDRRNRTAHWVFEHIIGEHCEKRDGVSRQKSTFKEDESVHPYFRSTNIDYKGSGFDRGHLAAASNHRYSQNALNQTFFLSNISPQVGEGFNRGVWNDLEKYTRAIARKNKCVYVCTGPLYLPRKESDGRQYVKYEVIGVNHVAVPTHFFKVLVVEDQRGQLDMLAFLMPNQQLPEGTKLHKFLYPVESIERAAGFLLFEKIPRHSFKLINGRKPD